MFWLGPAMTATYLAFKYPPSPPPASACDACDCDCDDEPSAVVVEVPGPDPYPVAGPAVARLTIAQGVHIGEVSADGITMIEYGDASARRVVEFDAAGRLVGIEPVGPFDKPTMVSVCADDQSAPQIVASVHTESVVARAAGRSRGFRRWGES